MITPELESQWIQALFNKDCVLLKELLRDHPGLLKKGWRREPSRVVKGQTLRNRDMENVWGGSTVFYAAAFLGHSQLLEQALRLCNLTTTIRSYPAVDEGLPSSSTKIEEITGETDLDESGVTKRKDSNIVDRSHDDAVSKGDQQKGGKHAQATEKSNPAHTGSILNLRKVAWTIAFTSRLARLQRKLPNESTQESASISNSSKHPLNARFGEDKDSNLHTTSGDFISPKDFRDLLLAKDGGFQWDAITIAILSGNHESIDLLVYAAGECENPPYGIKKNTLSPQVLNEDDGRYRDLLRKATQDALASSDDTLHRLCIEAYRKDREINFLPLEEYLFHFLCRQGGFESIWQSLWCKITAREDELWSFVLNLKDGHGTPPFHIAVNWAKVEDFVKLFTYGGAVDREVVICAMTALDGTGRTPVHRAAIRGRTSALQILLEYSDKYKKISDTCYAVWERKMVSLRSGNPIPIDTNRLSQDYGFGYFQTPHTPTHGALILKKFECAKLLIEKSPKVDWGNITYRFRVDFLENVVVELDTMELACLMGADVSVLNLLKDTYLATSKEFSEIPDFHDDKWGRLFKHPWHALHLVAASGNFENLKLFVSDPRCDSSTEDFEGNTPLHHALEVRGSFGFQTHLLDYDFYDAIYNAMAAVRKARMKVLEDKHIEERQRCIDHLLQVGCGIFKANKLNEIPNPKGKLEKDVKFMSWWLEKQSKELQATQNDCINAANAISVTAALVATASYVGPLQPPLGYSGDRINDYNAWVVLFMFCDTMSFYLAIAAITLSLIPSLPMPQRIVTEKPYTTRDMVTLALAVLFPSIFFVFLAFFASSIAVVSANVTSSSGGWFTLVATFIGGLLCLLAFVLFSVKLLAFIRPDNGSVRYVNTKVNNLTNFLIKNSQ